MCDNTVHTDTMGFFMRTLICLLAVVLSACGGGGGGGSGPLPAVNKTFSEQYIDLPNAEDVVKNVCTTASPNGGFSEKIAVADLNRDGINDLVTVYWCAYSQPGQQYNGPTPSTLVVYLSQSNGTFTIGNRQLFGTDVVDIGGQSNGFTVGDFNSDGKADIGIGVSREDGRGNNSTFDAYNAPQVVLLSHSNGTYSVERFAVQAASGKVQAVDNEVGGVDFVYPAVAQEAATAYRWVNDAWQQVTGYAKSNVGMNFFPRSSTQGSTKVLSLSTDANDGPASLQIQEKVNGQWSVTSKYVYLSSFVNVISWNSQLTQTTLANVNGTNMLYSTFEDSCVFKSSTNSESIVLARVGGFPVSSAWNGQTTLDERYMSGTSMLIPFNISNGIVTYNDLFDSPVADNFTNYKCSDVNNDGYMDVVTFGQGSTLNNTSGAPTFYINNKAGKLVKTAVDLPRIPQGANEWSNSNSLYEDMNGDGIPDLIYFTMETVPTKTRSSFRIYFSNKTI